MPIKHQKPFGNLFSTLLFYMRQRWTPTIQGFSPPTYLEKLATFRLNTDSLRDHGEIGSFHTFWRCPNLQIYFTSVFDTSSKVYKIKLAPLP